MIVTCRHVTKCFEERTVVKDLDLDVQAGECFGLLGPNGAGKTTTLKMIYGVTAPTSGTIHVFGQDVSKDPRPVRARLGVTLQENALIEVLRPASRRDDGLGDKGPVTETEKEQGLASGPSWIRTRGEGEKRCQDGAPPAGARLPRTVTRRSTHPGVG